jgi:hypothetical protein
MQALRGGRGITICKLALTGDGFVSTMLCPLYPRKDLDPILQEAGWALGLIWMAQKISPPPGFNFWTAQPIVIPYTNYAFPTY